MVDGSGLSRYNLISADSSVRLLAMMRKHKHFDVYFRSLRAYKVDLSVIDVLTEIDDQEATLEDKQPLTRANSPLPALKRSLASSSIIWGKGFVYSQPAKSLPFCAKVDW